MGVNCNLYIGSKEHSWKGIIPDVISLLFQPADYVAELVKDEGWCEHKLKSTCGKAVEQLARIGIDLNFVRELHFKYFCFDFEEYHGGLAYRCEGYLKKRVGQNRRLTRSIDRMVNLLLKKHFKPLTQDEEFSKVLDYFTCDGSYDDYRRKLEVALKEPRQEHKVPAEVALAGFHRRYLKNFLAEDPYLRQLKDEYRDVDTGSFDLDALYFIALSLFSSKPQTPLEFHFTEFIDSSKRMTPKEVKSFFGDMTMALQSRTIFANKAFGNVDKLEIKKSISPRIASPLRFRSSKEKGDHLEQLVRSIFVSQTGLKVKMNLKRPGEEIDLLIVNKLSDPFWTALQSPIILIECKNQKKLVEPKDIRNFEVKILDRRGMCRLGIIISTSGFTKNCFEAVAKLKREGHNIILIGKKALNARFENFSSTAEWLEDLIVQQC